MKIKYRIREIQVGGWVTGKEWMSNRSGATQAYKVADIQGSKVILFVNKVPRPDMFYQMHELLAIPPNRRDTVYYE